MNMLLSSSNHEDSSIRSFQMSQYEEIFLSSFNLDIPLNKCNFEVKKFRSQFNSSKMELSKKLYQFFNKEVFNNCLPKNIEITWNNRLITTAAVCCNQVKRDKCGVNFRYSRIEFSSKVIDSCDRLRDTLIHEMCHIAAWFISGCKAGHGPLWKKWVNKVMARFPELPVIEERHNYIIKTKYTYKCNKCGNNINRHSKSINTSVKFCVIKNCYGNLQLLINSDKL